MTEAYLCVQLTQGCYLKARGRGSNPRPSEMVYPPEDVDPSKYYPGPTCVNFVHATNSANHYATPPTKIMRRIPARTYCVNAWK